MKEEKMSKCADCTFFFPVPEDADDYEKGKGDCVTEKKDEKGKYWLSKPMFEDMESCDSFQKR
jgi:benzylsuccinate synthase/naphthyl-2-methylsuccinate synthase gamma subunit